jgi:GR25 family glycosyltransferase involved in LPS biosynthesis
MNSISDIKHAFYINLHSRPDRRQHVEHQLKTVGISAERFNGIKMTNGALGCSFSHLKLIETAKANNWEHILIIEDDILFTDPNSFTKQFNTFLSTHTDFDVLLIAGNNMPPFTTIDNTCVQVSRCQTTTCYLVQQHYYDTLIQNFREGINQLMREPHNHTLYAIDKYWFRLQEMHTWYLIVPLTVTQREDYSDIEKRPTNYSRAMLDLDKVAFFQWQQEEMNKLSDITRRI